MTDATKVFLLTLIKVFGIVIIAVGAGLLKQKSLGSVKNARGITTLR